MDPKAKKKALRMFSNGMYVITSRSGPRFGAATVTWVSQASFKPPLIMAAIRPESNVFRCLRESGIAAVHVLGFHQQDIAAKFFSPTKVYDGALNGEPFADGTTAAPILQNAPAYVECRLRQIVDQGGDHAIMIMEVVDTDCREQLPPLTIADSPWEYGG